MRHPSYCVSHHRKVPGKNDMINMNGDNIVREMDGL